MVDSRSSAPIPIPPGWTGAVHPSRVIRRGDLGYENVPWEYSERYFSKRGEIEPLPPERIHEADSISAHNYYANGDVEIIRWFRVQPKSPGVLPDAGTDSMPADDLSTTEKM